MEDYHELEAALLKLRKKFNYAKLEPLIEEMQEAKHNTNFDDPEWSLEELEEFSLATLSHISYNLKSANHSIDKALEIIKTRKKYNELLAKKKDINFINAKLKELGLELQKPPARF